MFVHKTYNYNLIETKHYDFMISVVLPTYNEKDNISKLIDMIEEVFEKNKIDGEILVIDDNSPDGTAKTVRDLKKKYDNITVFVRKDERGVGTAHIFGYKHAKGDIIIAMDCDLSHDPRQIPQFLKKIDESYDIVLGSRHIEGSYYEKKKFGTIIKYLTSRIGNILTFLISNVPIHDFSNGYRAIKRDVVKHIKTESIENSLLMEFILKAYKKGYRLTEIPVTFFDRKKGRSKLKLGKQSIRFFLDVFKFR